jgi:two-component system chemotaxis sensor kinase CheA
VREAARASGREVAFDAAGGDAAVDRGVLDALSEPLTHLLRNAVDHGIEPPAERAAAGKPVAGQIRVRARVIDGGGEVVVEDDGRGVDLEEVRRRAAELGFLPRHDADQAADADLFEVLFRPGFSTRTHVSDVSGRGIGLDAVRTALARAGGTLSISSRPGQGTTVVARVPQANRRIKVISFPAHGAPLRLAIPASFEVLPLGVEPPPRDVVDPLRELDIPSADARDAEVLLRITRETFATCFRAGGALRPRTAERFCPTPDDHPVEVVLIGEEEALLLRPELLLAARRRC